MSIHVFLGPTLSVADARRVLPDAHYWPPVEMGDVHALVEREQPRVIAIVDGLFERTPAVWHKEILFALSKGVQVHGAASMGALRAAELHTFGMTGHGRIFESFRDGRLEDDDEVAVMHAPAEDGYRLLSDAMVSLRHGLDLAARAGCISQATRDILVDEAKSRYYADRSWTALFSRADSAMSAYMAGFRQAAVSSTPLGVAGTAYMLEGISELRWGSMVANMAARSDIPNVENALSCLGKHAIADIGHGENARRRLRRITDPRDQAAILHNARLTIETWGQIGREALRREADPHTARPRSCTPGR